MNAVNARKLPERIKIWAGQVRAPFLVLSVLLTLIAGAVASKEGVFHGVRVFLAMIGVTLAHAAVNLFNEHSDYVTGIDGHTRRTPFSGGSGSLQQGLTRPARVAAAAWAALLAAIGIGLYLAAVSTWWVLALVGIGALTARFYTTHLAKWCLGEFMAGLALGTLVVIGTYLVQAGTVTGPVVWLSVPPGILTALLLLLNEFPDAEADRQGGRRHLVIQLGWKNAAVVYTAAMVLQYAILALGAWQRWFPPTIMLTWLTMPLAGFAAHRALRFGDQWEMMAPALGANVGAVLGTNLLIAVAYFL